MKRCVILFFLVLTNILPAEEELDFFDLEVSKEQVLDKRQNYFLTKTDYKIAPKVNPITGEYTEEEVDLVVAGSQPLSSRRFYNSSAPYDPRYATWRYNPEAFFVANMEWKHQEIFAAIGERDGGVCSFKPSLNQPYTFDFQATQNFAFSGYNGAAHPLNTKIKYWKRGDPKDKKRYQYMGNITDGSGRERFFISAMHRWTDSVTWKEKKGRWYTGGRETTWRAYANVWTPFHIPITEERLPNGNVICYTYTPWKEEKQNFPLPQLLSSITAYNADKSQVLGYIQFDYPRVKNNEVGGIQITGSDGRNSFMQHQPNKVSIIKLISARRAGAPFVSYGSHDEVLNTITKPDDRVLITTYNSEGKVSAQHAPVGANGEMCPIGRYIYHDTLTVFYDAENNKTHYRYDSNKKLNAVESYQSDSLYRIDRFEWDPATGNCMRKTIVDAQDTPVRITEYAYDANQNPVEERIGDGKAWHTVKRTYSEDGFNLKLSESDREGVVTRFHYRPGTNLLTAELVYDADKIVKRTFHTYDDCAICIKTIKDDGSSLDEDDLEGVTYRKITEVRPKQSLPCYGLPEEVLEKTIDATGQEILLKKVIYTYAPFGKILKEEHYDASNQYGYTIHNTYDDQERLAYTTDPLGNCTSFTYDANHNLTSITGPNPDQYKEVVYDQANRPIRISDRQTDGSTLTIEKKYDCLGQLIAETDACGNETCFEYDVLGRVTTVYHPDGSIEKNEYDVLGNATKKIDGEGYETCTTYNFQGKPTAIYYPDGREEHFTYNSTGTIATHVDKNGAKSVYTYDLFDRPTDITVYSSAGEVLKTTQSTYSPFCRLSETDGEGVTTTFTYDFCGRKIAEQTDTKKTSYAYDSLGRLTRTDNGDYQIIETYDNADRVIAKQILDSSGKLQFEEEYAYDASGNRTHLINSKGAYETLYNTFGKPLSEKNPAGYQTTHDYHFGDHYHHVTSDAHSICTTRIHDKRGREVASIKTNPQEKVLSRSESEYDHNGNLTTLTHHVYGPELIRTISHKWEYGPLGRLERFVEAGENQTQYLYDTTGKLITIVKPSGIQLHHEYDSLGRLARYFSSDFDYHYVYDRNDRVLSVNDSVSNITTTRSYTSLGDLSQEVLGSGLTLSSIYDCHGRRSQLTLPDNSEVSFTYQGVFLKQVKRNQNTFNYSDRDLEGCPLEMELPGDSGTIVITRDLLSRISTFVSPAYKAYFPEDAYDPVGNLLQYRYEDSLGKVECVYAYDQLNQLISENGHTYLFDSLNNRLEKDNASQTINSLCQVLHDGETQYEYDLDGNLTYDGQWHYIYDTQDRLIALESDNKRIEYVYDSFHRRLSKAVFTNNKRVHYERYLWDGDNEIGVVNEKEVVTQLRVLGEGLGAEIGAAVLYELDSKTYVPIHDHRGNVVALIDTQTQKPAETYRYTAFGEELTSATISPWRFSSKRTEEERGLIFFGRRYYLPTLGRWITQDPQGFEDGPNLYAYLSNCPLISIDPYGLTGMDSWWSMQDDYTGLTRRAMGNYFGFGLPQDYSNFENPFSNKSRTYSLNHDFGFNFQEPPVGAYLFGNGVGNSFGDLGQKAHLISNYSGYNTRGVYNATHGLLVDVHEACANLSSRAMTPPVYLYHQEWDRYFDHDKTGAPLWQAAHSQATVHLRNALEVYRKDRRDRIIVAAFAPFAYISPKLCRQVNHYVCPSDAITYRDSKGRRECEGTITYVPRMRNYKQSCHEFSNPIYLPYIEDEIQNYQKLLRRYGD